jgi:hypothetical protein
MTRPWDTVGRRPRPGLPHRLFGAEREFSCSHTRRVQHPRSRKVRALQIQDTVLKAIDGATFDGGNGQDTLEGEFISGICLNVESGC